MQRTLLKGDFAKNCHRKVLDCRHDPVKRFGEVETVTKKVPGTTKHSQLITFAVLETLTR